MIPARVRVSSSSLPRARCFVLNLLFQSRRGGTDPIAPAFIARPCASLSLSFVSDRTEQAFQTQKLVEQEARSLQVQATKFSKQTNQWMAAITTFDNALKELGDFENYVRTLEWEIQTVSDVLERITTTTGNQGAGPPPPSAP